MIVNKVKSDWKTEFLTIGCGYYWFGTSIFRSKDDGIKYFKKLFNLGAMLKFLNTGQVIVSLPANQKIREKILLYILSQSTKYPYSIKITKNKIKMNYYPQIGDEKFYLRGG